MNPRWEAVWGRGDPSTEHPSVPSKKHGTHTLFSTLYFTDLILTLVNRSERFFW